MNDRAKSLTFLLSLLLVVPAVSCGRSEPPPLQDASIGGSYTLTDQNGRTVRDTDFAGKYRIVYFGYTHCPDVCPTDLAAISQAMSLLAKSDPARAARVQPIFITVDPQRDTPAELKNYLAAFSPRLIGLTGTPAQIADAEKKFIVYARKGDVQPGGGYAMDHSRQIVLQGPKGEPLALLPDDQGPKAMAAELARWVK
ncbi:MAG TPA: SCO family protein [Allosphingosinicella sp.]|nr:SCO family protein [Allosphingosinicella sp.]